ncbi:MAG TPA: carboxypeptidase regulatory-like domain-containing protein [Blastocatellia bacterium]|nr:carboxypeptidase regulatory-like domain-containing protein [Blastocatellia bacterium]
MKLIAWALAPCLVLLLGLPVFAQKTSGQITGIISDQNGAAVIDTTVTVVQNGTGLKRTAKTNADGVYTVTDLPIGTYNITATREGFKEGVVTNVTVNVFTTTRQDLILQVGGVGERVEIVASDLQVETQTGSVGEVVNGEQVRELPLNGRSFVQLTQLQPGVSAANNFDTKNKGLFAGVDFSVNGNSGQSNLFLTDGANNNDTGSNRTILLYPSIEAIAEFKMLRNSYGPEYGQAAGSVISIATRGGENQFHGSVFYFGRNDKLNSAEYFARNAAGANPNTFRKDKLRRNDYGFSLGGPVIKDKVFFFYSQEWNKEIRGSTRFGSVPTAAERSGDFRNRRILANGTSCSGGPIGGGRPGSATQVIPQANLSQAGQLLTQLYPLPNLNWTPNSPTCDNWSQSINSKIDFREENARVDYKFSQKHQLFGRYTQDHWSNPSPILFGAGLWGDDPFPGVESSWKQPARQAAVKLTSTLSDSAVNEVQFSYSANRIIVSAGLGADLNTQINQAIPGRFPSSGKVNGDSRPHPVFWGGIQPFTSNRGADLWTEAPFKNSLDIYSFRDDFSKVYRNHTFRFGGVLDKAAKNEDTGPVNESVQIGGPFSTNNPGPGDYVASGNYLADILTNGSLFNFSEGSREKVANNRYTNFELYFGDSFKVKPHITLELGARYSIFFEPYDKNNLLSSFVPSLYDPTRPASDPCNGLVVPKGTNPCAGIAGASTPTEFPNRSLRENSYKNIAPRLGVAWDVFKNGKTSVRSGFGLFYLRERTGPTIGGLAGNSPFVTTQGGRRSLDGSTFVLDAASNGSPNAGLDPEAKSPYSLQYNISVGQQLTKDTVVEVGYVANRARNQLQFFDINQPVAANRLAAAFAGNNDAVNALRPYTNYGAIYQFARTGISNYDSLQLLFRTRLSKSLQFQAAYTWSKSLADFGLNDSGNASLNSLLDTYNPGLSYGPSDLNRPHMFVANTIYNIPAFKSTNPFVRSALGGWELAAIVQVSSGTSLTPNINSTGINFDLDGTGPGTATRSFTGGISGIGTTQDNQRPNRVSGVPCSFSGGGEQFLNPSAFSLAGMRVGDLGNAGRGICQGSATKNVDFSLYKNFAPRWLTKSFLGEGAKFQFRVEMFNALNTDQFRGDSITTIFYNGTVACGTAACSPTNNVITGLVENQTRTNPVTGLQETIQVPRTANTNFGRAGTSRGGREIQYALKLSF